MEQSQIVVLSTPCNYSLIMDDNKKENQRESVFINYCETSFFAFKLQREKQSQFSFAKAMENRTY